MAFPTVRQRFLVLLLTALPVLAPAQGSKTSAPAAAHAAKPAPAPIAHPTWTELSPAQKTALAPLSGEWDKLGRLRKQKWLQIANKYATMKPDEQRRAQERMTEWVRMTPEQHRTVRENYARAKRLAPQQKASKWEEYKQLPEEQKKQLANQPPPKKPLAKPPAHSASAATPVVNGK